MQQMIKTLQSIEQNTSTSSSSGSAGINSQMFQAMNAASQMMNSNTQSASDNVNRFVASLDQAAARFKDQGKILGFMTTSFDQMDKLTGRIFSKIGNKTGITKLFKGVKSVGSGIKEWGSAIKNAEKGLDRVYILVDGITSAMGSIIGGTLSFVGKAIGGFISLGKVITNSIVSVLGNALTSITKFAEFAVTLPIEIAKKASELGGQLRQELVEVIGTAVENTKELFDLASNGGDAFKKLGGIAKGSLLSFQSVNSTMTKLFGYGAQGAAKMIADITRNIADMGVFSEVFAKSTTKSGKSIEFITRMTRGMGMQAADLNYIVAEAFKNGEHYFETMTRNKEELDIVSTEFGVNRKRLSANFFQLRKDITQFGHLSDIELKRTAASAMQLGVEMKDVAAVFSKFNTFEDAANSAALLQQTFGMNIDALQLIRAEDPMEIVEMFRQSMLMTGRSFDDLNRHEKSLMASHTGMSAEALKQVMNYKTLGKSYEDIKKIMNDQKPEERQIRAMKDMASSMAEVQKIMNKKDFFTAFLDGFSKSIMYGTTFGDAMAKVNKAMENFYEEGLKLDEQGKKNLEAITAPFSGILDEIVDIFSVKGLRGIMSEVLENVKEFVEDITDPTRCFAGISRKWELKIKGLFDFSQLADDSSFLGRLVKVTGKIIKFVLKSFVALGPGLIKVVGDALLSVTSFLRDPNKFVLSDTALNIAKFLGFTDAEWACFKTDMGIALADIQEYLLGVEPSGGNPGQKGLFSKLFGEGGDAGGILDNVSTQLGKMIKKALGIAEKDDFFTSVGQKIVDGMVAAKEKIKELVKPLMDGIKEWLIKNTDFGATMFSTPGDSSALEIKEGDSITTKAVKRYKKGGATKLLAESAKDTYRGATGLLGKIPLVGGALETVANLPMDVIDYGYGGELMAGAKGAVKAGVAKKAAEEAAKKAAEASAKKTFTEAAKGAVKTGAKSLGKGAAKTVATGGLNLAGKFASKALGPAISILSEYAESEMNMNEALQDLDKKLKNGEISPAQYKVISEYMQEQETKGMFARAGGGMLAAALTGAALGTFAPGVGNLVGFAAGVGSYMLGSAASEYAFDTESAQEAMAKKLAEMQAAETASVGTADPTKAVAQVTEQVKQAQAQAAAERKTEREAELSHVADRFVQVSTNQADSLMNAMSRGFEGMHVMFDQESVGRVIVPYMTEVQARHAGNAATNPSHKTPGTGSDRAAVAQNSSVGSAAPA